MLSRPLAALTFIQLLCSISLAQVIDLKAIDANVDPCQDFYQYACGNWEKTAEYRPGVPFVDRTFIDITFRNLDVLRELLASGGSELGSKYEPLQQIYSQCLTVEGLHQTSVSFAQEYFRSSAELEDVEQILAHYARHGNYGVLPVVPSFTDFSEPEKHATILFFPSLTLGSKLDYTSDEGRQKRAALKTYMEKVFVAAGLSKELASSVYELEVKLSEGDLAPEQKRVIANMNNPYAYSEFKQEFSAFDWDGYLANIGFPRMPKKIFVANPEGTKAVLRTLNETSPIQLRGLHFWHAMNTAAKYMSPEFAEAHLEFQKVANGTQSAPDREDSCLFMVKERFPHLTSQLFVEKSFSAESTKETRGMVDDMLEEFSSLLHEADWLDDSTKEKALIKAAKIRSNIAHPDTWPNSPSAINGANLFYSLVDLSKWEWQESLKNFEGSVDDSKWTFKDLSAVNATYDPSRNTITFPVGILQEPFYSPEASRIANLAAIGLVIGHEITHGFDDQGRLWDPSGAFNTWWTEATNEAFNKRAQCVADQYSRYEIAGVKINGKFTLGENIADMGGLQLAYRMAEKTQDRSKMVFTDWRKEFFVAVAQTWCGKAEDAFYQYQVSADPHTPNPYRVRGMLHNMPQFAETYSCKPGDSMVPTNRCEVW